ncbi:MAG: efflux RND transporter periplasmic adaptor subunit [Chthoniobacteraceae bacterium]
MTAKRYQTLRNAQAVSQQDADEKNADRDADQAAVNSAAADVRQLEKTQGFEKVIAPFDGTISQRNVDVGALIQTGGTTPLFRMVQASKLRVYIQVPQDSARSVKVGDTGDVTLQEMPGRTFPAQVTRTADNIDVATRTLLVELQLDNPQGEILAGSHAQLKIKLPSAAPRMVLPANTLLFRAEGPQVGIVDADNKVQLRSVKIGRDLGKTLEILSGIEPNDRVIAAPPDSLTTGITVRVAQAPQAETGKPQPK